jgi:hypothetical protein
MMRREGQRRVWKEREEVSKTVKSEEGQKGRRKIR